MDSHRRWGAPKSLREWRPQGEDGIYEVLPKNELRVIIQEGWPHGGIQGVRVPVNTNVRVVLTLLPSQIYLPYWMFELDVRTVPYPAHPVPTPPIGMRKPMLHVLCYKWGTR